MILTKWPPLVSFDDRKKFFFGVCVLRDQNFICFFKFKF